MVMHNYLSKYINSDGRTQMSVVSGSSDIIGDDWPTETLDIEDIEAFGSAPGVSSASSLVHALEEQYQKQVNGIEDPNTAHNDYAIPAEEAVAGATRSDKVERSGSLVVSVTITYEYPGDILFYTRIYTDPFTITKHGCDPIRKMCY
jgi:hypothetical protein